MVDNLIEVLSQEKMGRKIHADRIKEVYHKEIKNHKCCESCPKGIIGLDIKHCTESLYVDVCDILQ